MKSINFNMLCRLLRLEISVLFKLLRYLVFVREANASTSSNVSLIKSELFTLLEL